MASGTVTLITDSVDYPCCPYGRGTVRLTNVIGWSVNNNGDISFSLISSSNNAPGGVWYICHGTYSSGYYVNLEPQVSYDGGSSWVNLDTKQHWVSEECGYGGTDTIAMSTQLINSLGTYHLTGNCQLRFLYYMTVAPAPDATYSWAFPNSSYSEVSQVPVVVEVDWTATLNYNANGGSGAPSSSTATVQSSVNSHSFTVSNTAPTRSNYRFDGWATSSSATTPSYHGGDTITVTKSDPTATLYAVWTRMYNYTLSYNANGGSGAPSAQTYYGPETSHTFTISNTKPTWTWHRFDGWGNASTDTTPSYQPGGSITLTSSSLSKTLYGVWTEYYRCGDVRYSGVFKTTHRTGGKCHLRVNGSWTEMRSIDGGTEGNDPPNRRLNNKWLNQYKIGSS